jgi:hypothetical protein
MAADSVPDPVPAPTRQRAERGLRAWHSGFSAEEAVARRYQAQGYAVAARRWRGLSGEIDLVPAAPRRRDLRRGEAGGRPMPWPPNGWGRRRSGASMARL